MREMRDRSTLAARGLAVLLPASNASPVAVRFVAARRSLRLRRPDSHTAAEKSAASHSEPAKNCGHRSGPEAAYASFAGRAGFSSAFPALKGLRPESSRPAADAPVADRKSTRLNSSHIPL